MSWSETKRLREEFDDCRGQAHQILARAKAAGRDLTPGEKTQFDRVSLKARELKFEIAAADDDMETIKAVALARSHNSRGNDMQTEQVLPTNGRLPGAGAYQPNLHHRIGKLKCFADPRDAYDAGMVMRAIVSREYNRSDDVAHEYCKSRLNWSVTNASHEGSGPAGGYLVPAPLSNAIVDIREKVGVVRPLLRLMPMTSDTLSVARRSGGLTVSYTGERQTMDLSDKAWSQFELIAKKRTVAHQISQELQDDALISVVDDAVNEMAYALADKEDQECINGDATSTYGGVLGLKSALGAGGVSTAASGHDTWGELDLADMTAAMGKLPDRFHQGMPVWLCSSAFYFQVLLRIHAQAGGNTIASLQGGDGGTRQFLGYPVYCSQYMPTATAASTVCAFFGSFHMGCILGERVGVRVARSDDFAFLNDLTTLKAVSRYDFKIHEPGTDTAPGCFIGLSTAAGG